MSRVLKHSLITLGLLATAFGLSMLFFYIFGGNFFTFCKCVFYRTDNFVLPAVVYGK